MGASAAVTPMSGKSIREPHFITLLCLAWLLVAFCLLMLNWAGTAETLNDTDDAMRLVQMRAWLAGQGWFDLHQTRVQPPLGFDSHWSRLIDAGLAGLFLLLSQFTDQAFAERLMRATWPLLWLFPTMAGMAAIAWRIAGRAAALVGLLLAVGGVAAYRQFIPGRIDHHNVQIALTLLVVAATAWSDRLRWTAAAAGALSGLALAIGFESLPYVAACGGAFTLRYVFAPDAAPALRAYALTLAIGTLAGFFISVGPDRWMHHACDAIAINTVAPVVAGSLSLAMLSRAGHGRAALCLVLAAVVAATALTFEPRCLGGPFAMVDPAIWPVWLGEVRELQPLLGAMSQSPVSGIAIATFPAAAVVAALMLAGDGRLRRDFGFLTAAAAFALAVVVTLAAIRGFSYAIWLGMPLVAAAVVRLCTRLETLAARLLAAIIVTPMVLSAVAMTIASAAGLNDHDDPARSATRACLRSANYAPLAQLAPGLVVADVNFGPFLLALTPHSVMAAPYHLLSTGIIDAHRALASPPEEAREVVRRTRATYVMICGSQPPSALTAAERSASLWGRLHAGAVPDWLAPVLHTPAFKVYRIAA